ncbi:MAG TPA: NAD-dependent DNA ligase LigA, partial [Flavobacteriales bacterium]|nr:NAD-dependent DNA ligase LigA [Flavobacteriales bacterium]
MELKEIENKIKELIRVVREHNHNYYVLSKSEISDLEYDNLLKELQGLELEYPEFADPNSPTKRVGGEVAKEFDTVIHKYPMLSLDNTYSKEEIREFDIRIRKILQNESPGLLESLTYVCELKYDGVAIGLIYKNGKLLKAVTRGDGVQGDDVTVNVRTIKTIPLVLKENGHPSEFEIRGEVFLSQSSFKKINQDRIDAGDSPFANPRNSAAGTLKMLDSRIVAGRNLDCYLYGMYGDSLPHGSHYSNMRAAKKWGFKVPDFIVKSKSLEGVFDFIDLWEKERNNIDVGIDGIV